jgi:hypothetical protein
LLIDYNHINYINYLNYINNYQSPQAVNPKQVISQTQQILFRNFMSGENNLFLCSRAR